MVQELLHGSMAATASRKPLPAAVARCWIPPVSYTPDAAPARRAAEPRPLRFALLPSRRTSWPEYANPRFPCGYQLLCASGSIYYSSLTVAFYSLVLFLFLFFSVVSCSAACLHCQPQIVLTLPVSPPPLLRPRRHMKAGRHVPPPCDTQTACPRPYFTCPNFTHRLRPS